MSADVLFDPGQDANTFWERLLATGSLGEQFLALWNGLAAETDSLLGVEH